MAIIFDLIIIGGWRFKKNEDVPLRARFAAETKAQMPRPAQNLKIIEFKVNLHENRQLYKTGAQIDTLCIIENTSEKPIKNFISLIRTPAKEIASVFTKSLAAGQKITLKGSFTPELAGTTIFACRADVDHQIEEPDENDNREVKVIYVQPE